MAAAVAAATVTVGACAGQASPPGRAFRPLAPAAAPTGWAHAPLPNRTAVLSYPPSLHLITGDTGTVTPPRLGPGGGDPIYLNATPPQRPETLPPRTPFRPSFPQ